MAEQAISQEQLFLPLLHFIADHGGEIGRQEDNLFDALADRLGLTDEECNRETEGRGRNQWQSTVEFSRAKLIDVHGAIEKGGTRGIWRLTDRGWEIVKSPPPEMEERFRAWQEARRNARPEGAPPPPSRPSGRVSARIEDMRQTLAREVTETLRIKRNGALARALREVYKYRCQLCGCDESAIPRIPMADGRYYVEAHHVQGLAEIAARYEHGQLDESEYSHLASPDNVVVVCSYHHMLIHHHDPPIEFVQDELTFRTADGSAVLPIVLRLGSHLDPIPGGGEGV